MHQLLMTILFFTYSFMPYLCLVEPNKLFVAQGPDIVLYQSKKKTRMLPLWQRQMHFRGHQFDVTHFFIQDDRLISSSLDNTLRAWNLMTGMCEAVYTGHTSNVHSVDGYGDVLVSGGRDKVIKVSNISTTYYHIGNLMNPKFSGILKIQDVENFIWGGGGEAGLCHQFGSCKKTILPP